MRPPASILLRQVLDLDDQLRAQCAAEAPIRHLDHLLVGSRQFWATTPHQGSVDIHFGHVIDDDREPQSAVVENVIEQCRLARPQKVESTHSRVFRAETTV